MKQQPTQSACGFTLIELMIAMILGLIIIGGTISIFLSNQQAFRVQDALEESLDAGRIAFEIIARDVREAGYGACPNTGAVTSVLKADPSASNWFAAPMGLSVLGYDEDQGLPIVTTGVTRKPGTDALLITRSVGTGVNIIGSMPTPSANLDTNSTAILKKDQIVMICDAAQSTIFQITQLPSGNKVQHNTGSGTPGNCSKFLGDPNMSPCDTSGGGAGGCPHSGTPCGYKFGTDATIVALESVLYFIGSPTGEKPWSLYRIQVNGLKPATPIPLINGIEDLQLSYGVDTQPASPSKGDDQIDAYKDSAENVGDPDTEQGLENWRRLFSVQINLLAVSERSNVSTDKQEYYYNGQKVTAQDYRLYKPFSGIAYIRSPQ